MATVLQVPIGQLPDLRLDERERAGMPPEDIYRVAQGEIDGWLAARGLQLVEHDRVPVDLPRWVGVIPFPGWFSDHCLVLAGAEILFDPTPLTPPPDVVQMLRRSGVPLRRRVWRPDEVEWGISFSVETGKEVN